MLNKKRLFFDCLSNVQASGYGSVYQNFTIELLRRGINLVGLDKCTRADVHLFLGQPDRRWRNSWERQAEIFGVFTMFEAELLPENWVGDINQNFDFVIVPSNWCKEIFKKGGVTKPVFVVPLGVNPAMFPYLERPQRDIFNVLWQGFHEEDRKGYSLVERAFDELNLFKARLIKKISPYALRSPTQYEIRYNRWSFCKAMTSAELLLFLREADLSVNPTSAEGFGLIPLEHMATGLPVMVSRNSGCLDYANSTYNIGIACNSGPSWFGEKHGEAMLPSYEDLKAKLQWAYEEREEIRKIGKRASEWVHREWNYEKATNKLLEAINEATRSIR